MPSILSRDTIRQVLQKAVSTGADFAEVYAEHTKSNSMVMIDGKIDSITDNFLSGVGVRVVSQDLEIALKVQDARPLRQQRGERGGEQPRRAQHLRLRIGRVKFRKKGFCPLQRGG